jgi:predicted polyphosphate/ATP-dependent NAD kinase
METLKVGLVVNPIAGVGAALAWKGTDNVREAWRAVQSGSIQPCWKILNRAIASIRDNFIIDWILGGNYLNAPKGAIVNQLPENSRAIDTKKSVEIIIKHKIDLLLFVGGDGTAVDIGSIAKDIPILGIPCGVKIFSPCFLHRPEDLGPFLSKWDLSTNEIDLLDLDEVAYQEGNALPKLVGSALIPNTTLIQAGKVGSSTNDTPTFELIAERIQEEQWLQQTIAAGPGSTMRNIFLEFDMEKSLLGVDIIQNGTLIERDCTTETLLKHEIKEIWLSPIGNQGHIFGRGNRQIPASLIKTIGKKNITIFATLAKMQETPLLYIDTGDPDLDVTLQGYYHVIVGYYEEKLRKAI